MLLGCGIVASNEHISLPIGKLGIEHAALLHIGIARLGRHHASEALSRGDLIEVLPKLHVSGDASMALFYPHRAGLAPRVRALVDFLLERFRGMATLHA